MAAKNRITLSRSFVERQGGVVVLPLAQYKKLLQNAAPAVYLKGRTARKLDRLVVEGLKEYRQGKTREIKSLADLDH